MTSPWAYGFPLNEYTPDYTAGSASGAGQRRPPHPSVASFVPANGSRPALRGAVSSLLNPSSPDDRDDIMHRGRFYSSVRYSDRNMMAGNGPGNDRSTPHGDAASGGSSLWPPKSSGLPWHSRAYEMFQMPRESGLEEPLSDPHRRASQLLSPSYLRGTPYMEKLEEHHKKRMLAIREGQRSVHTHGSGSGLASSPSSLSLHSNKVPPPSHRGMTLDVVEKPPKFVAEEEESALNPLPSRWSKDDKHSALEVVAEGYDVKYTGPKSSSEKDHEACAIRADHYMPGQCGVYYFEITVIARKHQE